MTKNNFLKTLALSAVLFLGTAVQAQVKVGANPTTLNANAVFEMESTTKGMLLPRLSLAATTSTSPLSAHVAGMVVYNTATAGDVTPGYFYNDGTKWVRLIGGAGAGAATTTAGPLITITNGAGATMTAMSVATDTTALKAFIASAIQNGAITGKNTAAGSLITVTNGAGATLTAMDVAVDTTALKAFLTNAGYDNTVDHWQNNGTTTYTTAGNVGIGTTTPSAKLDVVDGSIRTSVVGTPSATNKQGFIVTEGGTPIGEMVAYRDGSNEQFRVGSILSQPFIFNTNSVERMRITATGNVGIGTTAPTNTLHINSTSNPLRLEGLQVGAGTDEILSTDATGVVRKLSGSALAGALASIADTSKDSWFESGANTVDTTGYVGIGTTTPFHKLSVNGSLHQVNSTGSQGITLGQAPGSVDWNIATDITAPGTPKLNFFANGGGGQTLSLNYNGYVGIGTTTPLAKLQIQGDYDKTYGNLYVRSNNTNAGAITIGRGDDGLPTFSLGWFKGTSTSKSFIMNQSGGGQMYIGSSQKTSFGVPALYPEDTFLNEQMTINHTTGNVGIGTITPGEKLDVYDGSIRTSVVGTPSATNKQGFIVAEGGTPIGEMVAYRDGTNDQFRVGSILSQPFIFNTNSVERMRITATGNVGIGTTAPTNTLHINSTSNPLRLEGLQVGAGTDEILSTDATGVVRKLSGSALAGALASIADTSKDHWQNNGTSTYTTAGNVGIGNNNPDAALTIGDGTNNNSYIRIKRNTQPHIAFYEGSVTKARIQGTQDYFAVTDSIGATQHLVVKTYTGNVGIGTTTPFHKLSVNGSLHQVNSTGSQGITFGQAPGSVDWNIATDITAPGTPKLNFFANGGGGQTLSLNYNGNVGINTTTPGAKLDVVDGSIRTSVVGAPSATNKQGFIVTEGGTPIGEMVAYRDGTNEQFRVGSVLTQPFIFNTNSVERMRITSTGNVGIGTPAPTSLLSVNGTADKVGGGSWGTFSDARVKKNVLDYTKGLNEIMAIRPVTFEYNGKGSYKADGKVYVGVLAQEIEKVLPTTVSKIKTADFEDLRQYDSSELIYTLINAVKELKAEIETLKSLKK